MLVLISGQTQCQTHADEPRQTDFGAPTPVWQGVIDSTPTKNGGERNRTLSQGTERVQPAQSESAASAKSRGKPGNTQRGRLSRFSHPPPQAGSGTET